jgi:imidazolonepropionase-like amidohydrolase
MRPDVLLVGRVIDGTGREPLLRQALVLESGRIREILPQSDLGRTHRERAEVLDLGDATVLPGLIDTHVHLTFSAGSSHDVVRRTLAEESDARLALRAVGNAQAHLAGGVTTVRDVGGRGFVTLVVRDAVRDGLVLGPRVRASGPAITTPRGHLNYLGAIATGTAELRQRATEVLDAGADFVKLCATGGIMTAESDPMASQYTAAELRGAVEVAEHRGTLVAAHVLAAEALGYCVEAGVKSLEHCLWQDAPGEYRFQPELAAEIRQKGIIAGITFAGIGQARYREEQLGWRPREDMGVWKERMAKGHAASREMIDSGVRYVLHSDAGVRETPFGGFWMVPAAACYELRIPPLEAIRAVTATAAELMGLADTGTLEPGKRADLLVVDGDPSVRVEALAEPRLVLQAGRVVAEGGVLRAAGEPSVPEG